MINDPLPGPDSFRIPPPDLNRWFVAEIQPHEPALRRFLQRRFGCTADSDDIVQESFLRILHAQAAGTLRHPKAALFAIARNLAIDLFRRRRATPVDNGSFTDSAGILDERPDPAQAAVNAQETRLLLDTLSALPQRCQQVVFLRRFDGQSGSEVARRLGISVRTVETQINRALIRCSRRFQELGLPNWRALPRRKAA